MLNRNPTALTTLATHPKLVHGPAARDLNRKVAPHSRLPWQWPKLRVVNTAILVVQGMMHGGAFDFIWECVRQVNPVFVTSLPFSDKHTDAHPYRSAPLLSLTFLIFTHIRHRTTISPSTSALHFHFIRTMSLG